MLVKVRNVFLFALMSNHLLILGSVHFAYL